MFAAIGRRAALHGSRKAGEDLRTDPLERFPRKTLYALEELLPKRSI
jgi:hypothetical protein